jgi:hypothetical protein
MRRAAVFLLLLAFAACAGGGTSGPYVGGSIGGSIREDARIR